MCLSSNGAAKNSFRSQVGVGVAGGAEVAVHALRHLLQYLPDDHVFVQLDFISAFISVRRDLILQAVQAEKSPSEIHRFIQASFTCDSKLTFINETVISAEGAQQGDPLGSLEFCEALHPPLLVISAGVTLSCIDDVSLEGGQKGGIKRQDDCRLLQDNRIPPEHNKM